MNRRGGELSHNQSQTHGLQATFDTHADVEDFASNTEEYRIAVAAGAEIMSIGLFS
jgi:hypothetical protein